MPLNWQTKILGILMFVAIPLLVVLAYRGRKRGLRQELPQWRSSLGLTSIFMIILSWSGSAILLLSEARSASWIGPLALLALVGTILASALKGASRIEAIAAGFLMFVGITMSVY